jgi:hypothetical protein
MSKFVEKEAYQQIIVEVHTPVRVRLLGITQLLKSYGYKIDRIFEGVLYARAK